MSKTIEVSDQDYARIQHAADAAGMPLDAWVITNLPLESATGDAAENPLGPDGQPAGTMLDMLADRRGRSHSGTDQPLADRLVSHGLVGVVDSGGAERLSERHSQVFGDASQP